MTQNRVGPDISVFTEDTLAQAEALIYDFQLRKTLKGEVGIIYFYTACYDSKINQIHRGLNNAIIYHGLIDGITVVVSDAKDGHTTHGLVFADLAWNFDSRMYIKNRYSVSSKPSYDEDLKRLAA